MVELIATYLDANKILYYFISVTLPCSFKKGNHSVLGSTTVLGKAEWHDGVYINLNFLFFRALNNFPTRSEPIDKKIDLKLH